MSPSPVVGQAGDHHRFNTGHGHPVLRAAVTLALATTAEVVADGTSSALDLRTKAGRVMAEHAALVAAVLDGEAVLNR